MDDKHKREFTLAQMDGFFLYLPLYYAQSKGFFSLLPEGASVRVRTSSERTDQSAYKMLLDTQTQANRTVDFAICDPTTILSTAQLDHRVALVGAFIVNTPFWAVDTGEGNTRALRDLARFETIVSYAAGTTSHGIAKNIIRVGNGDRKQIYPVHPRQEWDKLKKSKKRTVILTPDTLGMVNLFSKSDAFNVEYHLPKSPEYANAITTALITRADVVREHQDVVVALGKALHIGMQHVRELRSDAIRYASERFHQPEDLVISALGLANDCAIYPDSIEIDQGRFVRTVKCFVSGKGRDFDASQESNAVEMYHRFVEPYRHIARLSRANEGANEETTPEVPSLQAQNRSISIWVPAALVMAACVAWCVVASGPLMATAGVLALCGAGGVHHVIVRALGIYGRIALCTVLWITWLSSVVFALRLLMDAESRTGLVPQLSIGLTLAWLGITGTAAAIDRHTRDKPGK